MATVTKGKTFISGETVEPADLHQLVDSATVTNIVNADIADDTITNAKIKSDAAIAGSKLADGSVTSAKIEDGTIVNADINASAAIAGSKLADAGITAAKLDGAQTGSAPVFGIRAWANFSGNTADNLTGTYSQSGNTVTVTATAHGHKVGHKIYADITSGSGVDGNYVVATVPDANTFTYTAGTSLTTSGNITLRRRLIRGSGNISSITYSSAQEYVLCFTNAMPNTNYVVMGLSMATNVASGNATLESADTGVNGKTTMFCNVAARYTTGTPDTPDANVIVIG